MLSKGGVIQLENFISTFIFILPGIMTYFWLQAFGLVPPTKHSAPELTGIAALLWLPVSFSTLFLLNLWAEVFGNVKSILTIEDFSNATNDLKYLTLFLFISLVISYVFSVIWSVWGHRTLVRIINKTRNARNIANYSNGSTVWEEFFIKIDEEQINSEDKKSSELKARSKRVKEAVYIVHKIDSPEKFIVGSMTKASRPFESIKGLVLEDTESWEDDIKNNNDYEIKKVYVDFSSGFIVKELDFNNPKEKPKPTPFKRFK